jgi:hypothetical protein
LPKNEFAKRAVEGNSRSSSKNVSVVGVKLALTFPVYVESESVFGDGDFARSLVPFLLLFLAPS